MIMRTYLGINLQKSSSQSVPNPFVYTTILEILHHKCMFDSLQRLHVAPYPTSYFSVCARIRNESLYASVLSSLHPAIIKLENAKRVFPTATFNNEQYQAKQKLERNHWCQRLYQGNLSILNFLYLSLIGKCVTLKFQANDPASQCQACFQNKIGKRLGPTN